MEKPKAIIKQVCPTCGGLKDNWYMSKDEFRNFFGNILYCKDCIKDIYNYYLDKYNQNTGKAIYYMCRKVDAPFNFSAYESSLANINNEQSTIQGVENLYKSYFKTINSLSSKNSYGNCFDDSVGAENIPELNPYNDVIKIPVNNESEDDEDYEILEYTLEELEHKWGNYSREELIWLQRECVQWERDLKGITDKSVDVVVEQICCIRLDIYRNRQQGRSSKDEIKQLQDLMKTSGLNKKENTEDFNNQLIGTGIKMIENNRPVRNVDPKLADLDNMKKLVYSIVGGLSKTLGKTNGFTEKFDEYYSAHSFDLDGFKNSNDDTDIAVEQSDVISDE